ncbi:MAG: hypothetical protein II008_10655 [Oscillospiraceae bacterium]|nr:hypothetical protein [Oscillospiraceae bacterium]
MSDILIKGMEMPENCDDCLLGADCPHDQSMDGYKMQGGRPRTCPLVPVPPHGRLIDADALLKKCEFVCTDDDVDVRAFRYSVIEDAPTIIPAEEDGHA